MKSKNILIFLILTLSINVSIFAGYLLRYNHPEIRWNYLKSGDFTVYYPENDSIEAQRILNILIPFEDSVDFILGAPKGYTSIVLNNYDEISNGMANGIGDVISLYTHPYYTVTTGNIDWLRRVTRHEFSHIATYKALTLLNWSPLRLLTMSTIPQWFYEGIAQYCAETDDDNRRMFVREGIKNGSLLDYNFLDQTAVNDIMDGRYYYEEGHGIIRMKMNQDSTYLKKILKVQSVLGLFLPFQINYLLATGHLAYSDFRKWLKSEQSVLIEKNYPVYQQVKTPFKYMKGVRRNESVDVYCGFNDIDIPVNQLVCYKGKRKYEIDGNVGAYFDLSPNGEEIVYSKNVRNKNGTILEDIVLFNLSNRKYIYITRYSKCTNPAFLNDSTIIYTQFMGSKGRLIMYNVSDGKGIVLSEPETSFTYYVTPTCFGGKIAFEKIGRNRYIKIINSDGAFLDSIYLPIGESRHPYFADDSTLYFTGYFSGRPEIYRYNLNTRKYFQETKAFSGHFQPYFFRDTLYFIDYHGKRGFSLEYKIGRDHINIDHYNQRDENTPLADYSRVNSVKNGRYNAIRELKLIGILPLPILDYYYSGNNGDNVYLNPRFIIAGMVADPLLKNVLYGFAGSNILNPTPTLYINYVNSNFYPTISFAYSRIPYISDYHLNGGYFTYYVEENARSELDLPVVFSNNMDDYGGVNFSLNYRRNDSLYTVYSDVQFYIGKGRGTYNDDILAKNNIFVTVDDKFSSTMLFSPDNYNLLNVNFYLNRTVNSKIINHIIYSLYYASGAINKTSDFVDKRNYGGFPDYDIPQRIELGTDIITGRNLGTGIAFITLPYINQLSFGIFSDNYCFYKTLNGDVKFRSFGGLKSNIKISYYYIKLLIEGGFFYDITNNKSGYFFKLSSGINGL